MVDYKQDLWPDEIKSIEVVSPVTIIKEQGKILGRKTNNIVVGEVKSLASASYAPEKHGFRYSFNLFCPSINYRYELFKFYFDIENYPVSIDLENAIKVEKFIELSTTAESEEELMKILKEIFSATKTLKVISGLLAQAKGIKNEDNDDPIPF